ncbi:hypothetical protein [Streptomyces sp. NPDC002156]
MALEDAAAPAECLRDLPRPQAPSRYEHLRRQRVEAIVALGARSPAARLKGTLPSGALSRVLGYRIGWAQPA